MNLYPIVLSIVGILGSMAVFTLVQRAFSTEQEDQLSLTRLAPKGPGEVSSFESLNPQGSLVHRLDYFLINVLGLGRSLENIHMLLGKPESPTPLQILHYMEMAGIFAGVFEYLLADSIKLALPCIIAFFFLPHEYYRRIEIPKRQREIIRNFPTFVDLAALTIESGLDYLNSFERIIQAATKKTELEKEMERTINEVSLGYTRRDALRRLAMRTGLQDVRSFVGLIIQSDELGTSLVDLLRNFSSDLRFRRLNAAEKAAAQASTKMLIPILLFIFPTVFILMLAPMMKNLFQKGGLGF